MTGRDLPRNALQQPELHRCVKMVSCDATAQILTAFCFARKPEVACCRPTLRTVVLVWLTASSTKV